MLHPPVYDNKWKHRLGDYCGISGLETTTMAQTIRSSRTITVLDPRGQPTAEVIPSPLAPRLDTLQGKTVYMVDIGFGGGYDFLEEAAAWLYRNVPSIKIELRHKRGNMFLDDPELWAEVKAKGNAAIFGVGG
jgi:hypothetical protein